MKYKHANALMLLSQLAALGIYLPAPKPKDKSSIGKFCRQCGGSIELTEGSIELTEGPDKCICLKEMND